MIADKIIWLSHHKYAIKCFLIMLTYDQDLHTTTILLQCIVLIFLFFEWMYFTIWLCNNLKNHLSSVYFEKITPNDIIFCWFSYNNSNFWLYINYPYYIGCLLKMYKSNLLPLNKSFCIKKKVNTKSNHKKIKKLKNKIMQDYFLILTFIY